MGWVERGVEGCRIDRKNESPHAIPQQKEDVIPSLMGIAEVGSRGSRSSRCSLQKAKKWLKNRY
jgi:hypothetical protein